MQEGALSRRMLIFTSEQVYWSCREATFCEESYLEDKLPRCGGFTYAPAEQSRQPSIRYWDNDRDPRGVWKLYESLVADYTRRTFSHQGDVFDGFRALLQGLSSRSGEDFIWGLPRSRFEQGLAWTLHPFADNLRRRTELSTLPMTSLRIRVPFPSWSWMGWIGRVSIIVRESFYAERGWVDCMLVSPP
jgi:hypothetical protein